MGGEAILNYMRRYQSCHNYHLPSPAKETERRCPPLSPACFTHKRQKIYRELFALPPLLGKIRAGRQSLILCVGIKVVTTTICPLPLRKQKDHAHHSPACFTHKHQQIYRKLLALPPSLENIRVERQSLILCVGIKVVTTTNCPLTPMKQKDHAHHSHPHASLTSSHKSIESFLHYNPRWERYRRRGNL